MLRLVGAFIFVGLSFVARSPLGSRSDFLIARSVLCAVVGHVFARNASGVKPPHSRVLQLALAARVLTVWCQRGAAGSGSGEDLLAAGRVG